MQHDRSPDDLRVGAWIPTQRTESPAQTPASPSPPTTPEPPASPANEATVVLPVFVTGKKPEQPPAKQAMAEATLPASERGMLLFVAALLGLGTIAVVAMMGFGFAGTKTKPKPPVTVTSASPSPVAAVPEPSAPPASPSPSVSPSRPAPSRTQARRSPTPSPSFLGALSNSVVVAYCQDTNNGMPWPPSRTRTGWTCVADRDARQDFTPTDVCQWRYRDGTARATVGDPNTPSTWRCYT